MAPVSAPRDMVRGTGPGTGPGTGRGTVRGVVRVPGDKSVSHRALIFAALADGISEIRGLLGSADVRSTAGVLRALGVDVPAFTAASAARPLRVSGVGLRGLRAPVTDLDCGNSGTTARLLAGLCAAYSFPARLTGDASLSRRPMRRVADPLRAMGATVRCEAGDGLPMTIRGAGSAIRGIEWENETSSAQVKSAILLAGLAGGVPVTVRAARASRDHTERFLAALGAPVRAEAGAVTLAPVERLRPFTLDVPGDPSSAAFFAALAALAPDGEVELPHVLASPTRDGFFRALARAGARVERRDEGTTAAGEHTVTYTVRSAPLRAVTVTPDEVPPMLDELPLLACMAARATGPGGAPTVTSISGAAELRVKESDRIAVTVANLRAIGVDAEERPDGLVVRGSGRPLRGQVRSAGDHRIAMAFGVLAALPGSEIVIDDMACVDVSYPGFWADLARLTVP